MSGIVYSVPEMPYAGCHMSMILPFYSTKGIQFQFYLGMITFTHLVAYLLPHVENMTVAGVVGGSCMTSFSPLRIAWSSS